MSRAHREKRRAALTGAATEIDWAALARREALPGDASAARGVEWIQTHLSHVYRTAERVYKFRKPVDLGFVSFASRAERNADCLREVALNRRLAPDVYVGVAPLVFADGQPSVGKVAAGLTGEDCEHCVVMRRLPDGRDLLSRLERGQVAVEQLDALAERIARFHAVNRLAIPAPFTPEEWIERCTGPAEQNLRTLAAQGDRVGEAALARARERADAFVAAHRDRFERRRRAGRAVDGHGDLHLQHVWYERDDGEPIAIDCLEFDERLRRIDAAADVAFLAMDLRYRGAEALAERFVRVYARESDDFDLYSVVDYFIAYRAGVRAKVASIAACDAGIAPAQRTRAAESAVRHLALASEALAPRAKPELVLVCGVVGTGKTSVAAALADRIDGVPIASDRVRKHRLGVAPGERVAAYAPEQIRSNYAALLERARPVLESGRIAILDATFASRARRAEAWALARELGCRAFAIEVRCAPEIATARLARRAAAGTDASDAGPELYEQSSRTFEALDEWPQCRRAVVATDGSWRESVSDLAQRILARHV